MACTVYKSGKHTENLIGRGRGVKMLVVVFTLEVFVKTWLNIVDFTLLLTLHFFLFVWFVC